MESTKKKKMSVESRFALWTCRDLGQIGVYWGTSPEGDARYDIKRNYTGRYGGVLEIWVAEDKFVTYNVPYVHMSWQKVLAALLARAQSDEEVPGIVSSQEE